MQSSTAICPVPKEQQPINEYQDLQESWFYSWATWEGRRYLKPIIILWLLNWLIAAPVATVSFPWTKYPAQFLLSTATGAMVIPLLILLRLYLGWIYIRDRLFQETIFYEESGWYDGQTWTKPEEMVQRDRLIVTYTIQPILQRLQKTFGAIALLLLMGIITWKFL